MNSDDDITNFWLAWRELCSIRLCMNAELVRTRCKDAPVVAENAEEVVNQARAVIETTNSYFAGMISSPRNVKPLKKFADKMAAERPQPLEGPGIESLHAVGDAIKRGKLVSEYMDLVAGWNQHDEMTTNAFELVEIDLYREAAEKMEVNGSDGNAEPMLNGKKLKDYLFEDIGCRPGGLCQNLWGYLLKEEMIIVNGRKYPSRLRMVANASFRNPVEEKPRDSNDDEVPGEPVDPSSLEPDTEILVREAGDEFKTYLLDRWATDFDVADRVVLCCAFFEYVLSDPFVESLVPIAKSALSVRKNRRVAEVFSLLKGKGFEFDTVRILFCGHGQQILKTIAVVDANTRDDACVKLVQYFEKRKVSAGN